MTFFIGKEVETTNHYGKDTLFVVGCYPVNEIIEKAFSLNIGHVYLGANHSIDDFNLLDVLRIAQRLSAKEFDVTIDFDIKYYPKVYSWYVDLNELVKRNITLNISCKLPYIEKIKNVNVKVDDNILNKSNKGVWVFNLDSNTENFTKWDAYNEDRTLD